MEEIAEEIARSGGNRLCGPSLQLCPGPSSQRTLPQGDSSVSASRGEGAKLPILLTSGQCPCCPPAMVLLSSHPYAPRRQRRRLSGLPCYEESHENSDIGPGGSSPSSGGSDSSCHPFPLILSTFDHSPQFPGFTQDVCFQEAPLHPGHCCTGILQRHWMEQECCQGRTGRGPRTLRLPCTRQALHSQR